MIQMRPEKLKPVQLSLEYLSEEDQTIENLVDRRADFSQRLNELNILGKFMNTFHGDEEFSDYAEQLLRTDPDGSSLGVLAIRNTANYYDSFDEATRTNIYGRTDPDSPLFDDRLAPILHRHRGKEPKLYTDEDTGEEISLDAGVLKLYITVMAASKLRSEVSPPYSSF